MDTSSYYISTYIVIAITVIISLVGFSNNDFFEKLKFQEGHIKQDKQWYRTFTSGFLHVDWMHLFFNMYSFYAFAPYIVSYYEQSSMSGNLYMIIIYFVAILFGSLLSYYYYQKDMYYSAVGASGGVTGIIFAAVIIDPTIKLSLMFIPIGIPGWVFGIIYLAYSIYAMRKNTDNVGHTAHLGGAIAGLAIPLIIQPSLLESSGKYVLLMCIPIAVLAYFVIFKRENYNK